MLQFWKISTKAEPLWAAAAWRTDVRCLRSVSIERATNVASAPIASESGLNGQSSEPIGVDLVTLPSSLVGEYWPFVSPWIWLLPPIESASPSPVTTHTDRSRRDDERPVAIAGARPWIECIPYVCM